MQVAPRPSAAPLRPADRVEAIDIVRGIALFGVMGVNLVTVFRVSLFKQFLPQVPASSALDRFADAFVSYGLSMKAWSLFSLLFGVGLAIQFERLSRTGAPLHWLARRLAILLVFGLTHLLLIWNGDILTEYAIAGFIVLPFLGAPLWLTGMAAAICLAFYTVMPVIDLPLPWPTHDWFQQHVAHANEVYAHGSFGSVLQFSLSEVPSIVNLLLYIFPRTVGLFLLGVVAWRVGILRQAQEHKTAITALAIAATMFGTALTFADLRNPGGGPVRQLAPFILAIGYGAQALLSRNRASLLRFGAIAKSGMGFVLVFAGGMILTGLDRKLEALILNHLPAGWVDLITRF